MKKICYVWILLVAGGAVNAQKNVGNTVYAYKPDSQELYDAIVKMDSIFFDAYNNCKMDVQEQIYSDTIEFYHDKGGLMTSKQGILDATKKNICGKVVRTLVPGSVEVYPIAGFGAIEIGLHRFFNKQEPDAPQHDSKFIMIWKKVGKEWKITRVVSLH
jgi:hypothetical protein